MAYDHPSHYRFTTGADIKGTHDEFEKFIDFIGQLIQLNPAISIDVIRTGDGSTDMFKDKDSFLAQAEKRKSGSKAAIEKNINFVDNVRKSNLQAHFAARYAATTVP